MTLWDIALEEARRREVEDDGNQVETTVLFVGSKKVGKTTVISRFLNKNENPKPTIALEYAYGRQNKSTALTKDICHIWELGGGTLLTKLLEVPITAENLSNLIVVVMVDLTAPQELLYTLETLLSALRSQIDQLLDRDDDLKQKLSEAAWNRVGSNDAVVDRDTLKAFPVPLVILGGKYDIFQDMDPEQKKIICRTLRFIAYTHGAALQFFSSKVENLVNRTKALISNLAFGTTISQYISQDYNKPLVIPFGADTLHQIETIGSTADAAPSYTVWKNTYETYFPQVLSNTSLPDDPAKDPNFKEPIIDTLRARKDEELERYSKEFEHRRKLMEDSD